MSFLTPLAFIGLLLAIPIILLYMLRLRRREVVISSTYLWQQILQDKEANTPWQRLKRNLLLFLQLIILALIVLALARPYLAVPTVSSGQTALLIDASASMNAADVDEGTRFDAAKAQARAIVDTLSAGAVATVIRVGAQPEVLTPYTADREALRDAIDAAQPGTGSADWLAALTLASAGGAGAEDFAVVLITDGGVGEADNLPRISIPGAVRFVSVGESADNIALTALAARALPGQAPQLFAQITNYGTQDAEVIFSLRVDQNPVPLVSERYTVPAGGSLPVVSAGAITEEMRTVQASVTLSVNSQARDYLPDDNTAWAVNTVRGTRRVLLVTEGNLFLEQMFASITGVELVRTSPERPLPAQPYDLYVFDGVAAAALPSTGDLFFVNPPASNDLLTVGAVQDTVQDVSVNTSDPRMTFVDFDNVNILRYRQITVASWADALIRAGDDALLLAGETGGRQVAALAFDLRDSDLPLQIAYPVLMSNLLEWFAPGGIIASGAAATVGDAVTLNPPLDAQTLRVVLPDSTQSEQAITRDTIIFTDTQQVGLYRAEALQGGQVAVAQNFAVNLFAPQESDIAPRDVSFGGQSIVLDASEQESLGQLELWWLFALGALLLLLIEWIVYYRRLQVPTVGGVFRGRGQTGSGARVRA